MPTDSAIDAMAAAVFREPNPWVTEAYSAYEKEPLLFTSKGELVCYLRTALAEQRGLAFVFVVYPDMKGRVVRETIHLKPGSVRGHALRYTWQGWGLISVQLSGEGGSGSRVAENSRSRAEKWAATYPNWDGPDTWNWTAVRSHERRLQRLLRGAMNRLVTEEAI